MKLIPFWVLPLLLIFSGCATHRNFEQNIHSLIGASSEEVLQVYGPPTQIIPLPNGSKIWSYHNERISYIGSSSPSQPLGGTGYFNTTTTSTSFIPIIPIHSHCTFWFVFSPHGSVEKVGDRGNHCVDHKRKKILKMAPSDSARVRDPAPGDQN